MPESVGLDTSFVIGLLDDRDLWHVQASELQASLQASGFEPIIFDCVLSEVISTLARRIHEKRREADLDALVDGIRRQFPVECITWSYPDLPTLYEQVIDLVQQSAGELNFNDALLALSCRDRGVLLVASFDEDFDRVGWLKRIACCRDLTTWKEGGCGSASGTPRGD